MVICFDTEKAREARVPVKGAAVKLTAAQCKALGGTLKGGIPLSACRFTGATQAEIVAEARKHASAAGVKEAAVPSFLRFNTAALRARTVPYGGAAAIYFAAAKKAGATVATDGITRVKREKATPKAKAKATPKAKAKAKATTAKAKAKATTAKEASA